jgi:uncharacterized protein
MLPIDIIEKYYNRDSELYKILIQHSCSVSDKALEIAKNHPELGLDEQFIYEAAMIHDIGIFKTDAPDILCFGTYPYICHGYFGSEIMKKEGYPKHALVCERHTGTGISKEQIIKFNYPIPERDMIPMSMEEKLVCFSDKFYSKTKFGREKSIEKIRKNLSKYGEASVRQFEDWRKFFLG